jgi:isochorismate pyruvate lyase
MIAPDDCRSMADVRAGVDALDAQIVGLLGVRFRFMAAAARIKRNREDVRDEERKAAVIKNVLSHAANTGVPKDLIGALYEAIVEASIAYEFERYDERYPWTLHKKERP